LGAHERTISQGIAYLQRSSDGNFSEAMVTMARIHENREFWFEKNKKLAAELLSRAARVVERDSG
jgi:hypothetical protein